MTRLISTMIVLTAVILTRLLFAQLGAASAPATVPAPTPTGTITPPQPGTPTPTRTATSTVEPEPGTVTALRAGARPVIDGNLDEWQTLAQTLLNKGTASSITGEIPVPADLSAGLRAAWAPEALYFAAAMADDVLVGSDSPQIWGDDSIELSVRAGGATHQFTVALDGRQADLGSPITSLTVATRTVTGGWVLEVAVPAAALGLAQTHGRRAIPLHVRPLGRRPAHLPRPDPHDLARQRHLHLRARLGHARPQWHCL